MAEIINMYLLVLTFTKTTVMRLKTLSFIILALFSFANLFGQQAQDTLAVAKVDTLSARAAIAPRAAGAQFNKFDKNAILLSAEREADPKRKSVFYSNAKIYVAENTNMALGSTTIPDAVMYVEGTMKYDNQAEIHQAGETVLTGDFVSVKNAASTAGTVTELFKKENGTLPKGIVRFAGRSRQHIVREDLDSKMTLSNNPSNSLKVGAKGEYVLQFPTIKVDKGQFISLQAAKDIIAKPLYGGDVSQLLNNDLLVVNSNVAMSVDNLDISNGNRFSVDVNSLGLEKTAIENITYADVDKADFYKINPAYVNVKKITGDDGHTEVNMRLYDYDAGRVENDYKTDEFLDNDNNIKLTNRLSDLNISEGSTSGITAATFLRGFTSPFDNLRADYMFYHVLTQPSASSLTSWNGPFSDPRAKIIPGYGYFMAMDVSKQYFKEIYEKWHGNDASHLRARGGYNFSRVIQRMRDEDANDRGHATKGGQFSLFTFDSSDTGKGRVKESQRFNVDEVAVEVQGYGVTFLANPFMTPINLSGLLAEYKGTANDDISDAANYITFTDEHSDPTNEVSIDNPRFTAPFIPRGFSDKHGNSSVLVSHALTADRKAIEQAKRDNQLLLRSRYWIIHSALIANTKVGGMPMYAYNVKYDNVVAVAQAATQDDIFNRVIEPMQMFVVQAATTGKFTFTQNMKSFKGKPFEAVLRDSYGDIPGVKPVSRNLTSEVNDNIAVDEASKYVPKDWFVVQAIATGKDQSTIVDRTAIRFFDKATQVFDPNIFDEEKRLAGSSASTKGMSRINQGGVAEQALEESAPTNVIYTKSAGLHGTKLQSYGVGYKTKEIPLYYVPAKDDSESVVLSFMGVEGFDRLHNVKLYDKRVHGDRKNAVDVTEGFEYAFQTDKGENVVDPENRFILIFGDNDDDGEPSNISTPITCYYSGSVLHIGGLMSEDMGSLVQIFDLQGRLMGSTTVSNYPAMEYPKTLGQGTFIVNINGARNYKTKFVNLQNY